MSHEQTLVKVNAKVDRGIAVLVESLNELPDVITGESCEGDALTDAYIGFYVRDGEWKQVGEFLNWLSLEIRKNTDLCDESSFSLSLEWYTGSDSPIAYLRVPNKHIERMSFAIRKIAENLRSGSVGFGFLVARDAQSLAVAQ
jgi:hypothetical protein